MSFQTSRLWGLECAEAARAAATGKFFGIEQGNRPGSREQRHQMRAWRLGLCAVAASLALSGCSSTHLYSKTRDTQATAAKEAFDKLELQKGIDTERANLDKLLVAELAMQDRLAQGVRDFQLRAMVEKSTRDGLVAPIELRIGHLAGSVPDLEAANGFAVKQAELDENFARYQRLVAPYGVSLPSCGEMDKLDADKLPPSIAAWLAKQTDVLAKITVRDTVGKDLRAYCAALATQPGAAYANLGGEIGGAWNRYQSDLAALNAKKAAVKPLKDAYAAAQVELDNAIALGDSEPESRAAVKKAVENVQAALAKLKGVGDNPVLDQFLSEKRIESVESFLTAVSEYQPGQEKLPASAGKAAMLATVLPGIVDDTRATLRKANKPLVTPYVLARNYYQLNLEAANRDIAASEAIVRHSKEIADVLYVQAQQLLLAYKELHAPLGPNGASVASKYSSVPFMDALKSASPKERQQLYSATARYLDALKRLDGKRYKLEYVRIADFHARSLAYAEINTKQWESLLGTSVTQLQEYGSGGLKSDQFVGLFNSLMLLGIAWGVN